MKYQAISVSELNAYIKGRISEDEALQSVLVKGEISNFKNHYATGHLYFTLKDEKSLIKCIMFKGYAERLDFTPKDGMSVMVFGSVSVYERDGVYQIYVQAMQEDGLGSLYKAYEELKIKLEKEGLFSEAHKKKIPMYPKEIGVLTSQTGAVIRDIINVSTRRNPNVHIKLLPVPVQGLGASEKITEAIETINKNKLVDVIILARGGGSLEDLWPFNEEKVVRQIYAMQMPVISSVGHETDTTLADLVADARAATPTAAAEYATPNLVDVLTQIVQLRARLYAAVQANIHTKHQILDRLKNAPVLQEPTRIYDQQIQQVDMLIHRLNQAMDNRLQHDGSTLRLLQERLKALSPSRKLEQLERERNFVVSNLFSTMNNYLKDQRNRLNRAMQQLDDISPLKTISRGYVYTTDQKGNTVTSVDQLKIDEKLKLHFKDGQVQVNVENIRREKNGNQEK